jgi:ribosomal protein L25 (general stress protein Ctc)
VNLKHATGNTGNYQQTMKMKKKGGTMRKEEERNNKITATIFNKKSESVDSNISLTERETRNAILKLAESVIDPTG